MEMDESRDGNETKHWEKCRDERGRGDKKETERNEDTRNMTNVKDRKEERQKTE